MMVKDESDRERRRWSFGEISVEFEVMEWYKAFTARRRE